MIKTTQKRKVKTRVKNKIQQSLANDLKEKTKAGIIQKDKQLMKEYIKNGNTFDIKDILTIRLHLWDVKKATPKMNKIQYVQFAENKIKQKM